MFLRLCSRRALDLDGILRRLYFRRLTGSLDALLAAEVLARERLRVVEDVLERSLARSARRRAAPAAGPMSMMWSAARMVSSSCSTTITVLPMSRKRSQRADQPVVVALVQADGRLVQHVADADQAAADLRGQADPLGLAAGERAAHAVQRQVAQPDVDQEFQAVLDFLEDLGGDQRLLGVELKRVEEALCVADADPAHLADVLAADRHRHRLRPQPRALARPARLLGQDSRAGGP